MSNFIVSPNMNLPVPDVALEPGPQYAIDINSCFSVIDGHNHAPGSGVQVPSAGININVDLPFNGNNATFLRSSRYSINASPLSGASDLACSYSAGPNGELYWNDLSGNQVQLTNGGSPAGSAGTITGLPSGTASAAYSSVSGTFIFERATATAANLDIGTIVLRYPGSYPSPSGNFIALEAPSSLSTGFSLVLPANLPGSNSSLIGSSASGVLSYFNVDGSTLDISGGNTLIVKTGGITATQIANQTITNAQIAPLTIIQENLAIRPFANPATTGQIAASSNSGSFSTASSSFVSVTNLSVTLTTTGSPVWVGLEGVASTTPLSSWNCTTGRAELQIVRDVTPLSGYQISNGGALTSFPGFLCLDNAPNGLHSYTVQIRALDGGTVNIANAVLVAYEI